MAQSEIEELTKHVVLEIVTDEYNNTSWSKENFVGNGGACNGSDMVLEGQGLAEEGQSNGGGAGWDEAFSEAECEELLLKLESMLLREAELSQLQSEAESLEEQEQRSLEWYISQCGEDRE